MPSNNKSELSRLHLHSCACMYLNVAITVKEKEAINLRKSGSIRKELEGGDRGVRGMKGQREGWNKISIKIF